MSSEINSSDNENKTNLNEDIRENENTNDGSFNAKESGKSEDEMINEALNDAANADVSDESNDVESTGNTDNAENSDTGETTGSDEFHEKTEDEKIDEELKAAENIENVDETPSSQNDLNEDPDQLNAEPEDKSPFAPDANQNDSNIDGSLANDSETQAVADESVVNSENPEKSESEENEGVSAAAAEISDELTQEENAENSESGEGAETSNAVPEISAEANPENDTDALNETSETTDNPESEHNPDEAIDTAEITDDSNSQTNTDKSDERNEAESTGNTDNAENSVHGDTTGSGEYHEKTEDEKIDEELKAAENIENVDETPSSENDLNENPDQLNAEPEDKNPYAPDENQNDSIIDGSLSNDSETQVIADESVINSENPEKSESEENEGVSATATEISDEFNSEENANNSESGEGAETSNAVPEISAEANSENNTDKTNEISETIDAYNSDGSNGISNNSPESSEISDSMGNPDETIVSPEISDGSDSRGIINESNDGTSSLDTSVESNAVVAINTETDNPDRTEQNANNVSLELQVDEHNTNTENELNNKELLSEEINAGTDQINTDKEVSEEIQNALTPFINSWDNLSFEQRTEAINNLHSAITNALEIQQPPSIQYINLEDASFYGAFSKTENIVYINQYNINNSVDIVNAISHEDRHCWQYQIIDASTDPQAQIYKDNFEHYIQSETDYQHYINQPVEKDAQDYAAKITSLLPATDIEINNDQVINENQAVSSNSQKSFEGNIKSAEILYSYNKYDINNLAKQIAKNPEHSNEFYEISERICQDKTLSVEDKVNTLQQIFDQIPNGCKPDILVIADLRAITTDPQKLNIGCESGYLPVEWHGYLGLNENKPIYGLFDFINSNSSPPEVLHRRGLETGTNLTILDSAGNPPDNDKISFPYIDNIEAQHFYQVNWMAYKEAIDIIADVDPADTSSIGNATSQLNNLIDNMNKTYGLSISHINENETKYFQKRYNDFQTSSQVNDCRSTTLNPDSKYGFVGEAAPLHVADDPSKEMIYSGGATQFNIPAPVAFFTRLGVFRE